jgi:hypothetical protein
MTTTFAAWLTALADHLHTNTHLDEITRGVTQTTPNPYVQVYPAYGQPIRTHLGCLDAWANTLTDVTHIQISAVGDSGTVHLEVTGRLADNDTYITVVALPKDTEADLLAQHTTVEQGGTFPIDLLHHLATHPATSAAAS